jgi:N-carbamoyl-L-amino-acid hydrolase
MYKCDLQRMQDKIRTFAQYGATGNGGITRYALSAEDHLARDEFVRRMEVIGAVIEYDDVANVYATLQGSDPNAKRIVIASHTDSVRNGGNYDGILGVISGMEVLETVTAEGIPHKHPLTAMIWTNEEGSQHPPAMMASGIVCNEHLPPAIAKNFLHDNMMASKSVLDLITSFGDLLDQSKYKGPKAHRFNRDKYKAMFELHIEQGPILEDNYKAVGVVQCVLGMFNYRLRFYGFSAHAGTFPMHKRHDALYAAAQALCHLHTEIDKLGRPELVYTTGEIVCLPCVHTVIPRYVDFCIDVRHEDPAVLEQVMDIIRAMPDREWAKCRCEIAEQWKRDTVYFDPKLIGSVRDSATELGISHQDINSGAGHDAQFASYVVPTTMIFVRTKDGLSHCENEYASLEDCTAGASVLLNAVLKTDRE